MNLKSRRRKCSFGENIGEECNNFKKVATDINIRRISMENVKKVLQVSATAGGVLSGLWFLYDHHIGRLVFAASGGRMGGSDFSSSSSSRSSSSYGSGSSSSSSSYYLSDSSSPNYRKQIGSPAPKKVKLIRIIMTYSAIFFAIALFLNWCDDLDDGAKTSVIKIQVGSLGTDRLLQKDLNRIAKVDDTSNSKGLQFVLQESILALLRHSEHWLSGYSSVNVKRSVEECEKQFNWLSLKERVKFDEETLVNVNNLKMKSATRQSSNGLPNEYIVATIIVAACGVHELPPIRSTAQLKEALQKLASIPSSKIMGVEVLWAPQKEDDSLTEQEMLEDYPLLRPISITIGDEQIY